MKNILLLCEDIIYNIGSFFDNGKDLITWSCYCRQNYDCFWNTKDLPHYFLWYNLCKISTKSYDWFFSNEEEKKFMINISSYALFILFHKLLQKKNKNKQKDHNNNNNEFITSLLTKNNFIFYPLYSIIWNAQKNRCSFCYNKIKLNNNCDNNNDNIAVSFRYPWICVCTSCQTNKYYLYGSHLMNFLKKKQLSIKNNNCNKMINKKDVKMFYKYKKKLFVPHYTKSFKKFESNFVNRCPIIINKRDQNISSSWRMHPTKWAICFGKVFHNSLLEDFYDQEMKIIKNNKL